MATVSEHIQQIYMGLLGRVADQAGLDYWEAEISASKLTLEHFRANIVNEQPEYANGLGSLSREQAITALYDNLFQRAPEPEGLEYWLNGGGAGVNFDQLVLALIDGASENDQAILNLKVGVSELPDEGMGGRVLVVTEDATLDELVSLESVELSGIQQVVLGADVTLTLSTEQAVLVKSSALSVMEAEVGAKAWIELEVDTDLQFSSLLNEQFNAPGVEFRAEVQEDATLTLGASELDTYFGAQSVGVSAEAPGQVVVTDAGLGFNPYLSSPDPCNFFGGSLSDQVSASDALTIVRSLSGYERPVYSSPYTDILYINTDETGNLQGPIAPDFSAPILIAGSEDLIVEEGFAFTSGFRFDFSELEGQVQGLTLRGFHWVSAGEEASFPCQKPFDRAVLGNNAGARINVEIGADLGDFEASRGLLTSGVPVYVVTGLYDETGGTDINHRFLIDDGAQDLETLGLKSNAEGAVDFLNVPNDVGFLLEGDGLQTFSGGYDSIGSLSASYDELVQQSTVTVTSLAESFAPRTLKVAGIDIDNAESLRIDVVGGASLLESLAGDSVQSLILSSAADVTLDGGLIGFPELLSVDASRVLGEFTLQLADCHNDLSGVTLSGIDAIELPHGGSLALQISQLDLLVDAGLEVLADDYGQQRAVLQITLDEDANLSELLDLNLLGDHLKLQVYVANGATLTLSAEELDKYFDAAGVQHADGNVVITDAGVNFNPYATELPGMEGGALPSGISLEPPANITLQQSEEGYERPAIDLDALKALGSGAQTFSADFIEAIGVENFLPADGAEVTINVTDLNDQALDLDLMVANGINVGLVNIWIGGAELHADTTLGGADTVLVDPRVMDVTLEMTAEQFQGIEGGGVVGVDGDCGHVANVLIDQLEALEAVGETTDGIAIDLSGVSVSGSRTLMLGDQTDGHYTTIEGGNADVVLSEAAVLGDFTVDLYDFFESSNEQQPFSGERIAFSTVEQAERTVTVRGNGAADRDTTVVWEFNFLDAAIDASGYVKELGDLRLHESLVAGVNIDSIIEGLHTDIPLTIYSYGGNPGFPSYLYRQIVVELFAQVPDDAFLIMEPEFPAESIDLTLQGGGSIGDFPVSGMVAPNTDDVTFSRLTIFSEFAQAQGETPLPGNLNVVGDISAGANAGFDLLDVSLNTDGAQLSIGTIEFSSSSGESIAVLATDGDAAIEMVSLNILDDNVEELAIAMSGAADVNVLGADITAAIAGVEVLRIALEESSGDLNLGSVGLDDEGEEISPRGIDGDSLRLIEISGAGTGSVNLGVIAGISPDDFTLVNSGENATVSATVTGEMDGSAFEGIVAVYEAALLAFAQTPSEVTETELFSAYQTLAAAADNSADFSNHSFGAAVSAGDSEIQENIRANYTWDLELQSGDRITVGAETTFTSGRLNLGGADLIVDGDVDMSNLAALDGVGSLELSPGSQLTLPESLFGELNTAESVTVSNDGGLVLLSKPLDDDFALVAAQSGAAVDDFDITTDALLIPDLVNSALRGDGTHYEQGDISGGAVALGENTGLVVNSGISSADLSTATQAADIAQSNAHINPGDAFYYLTDNGVDAALFLYEDVNGNAAVDADEVSHVLTLTGVADATLMTSDNFADFV